MKKVISVILILFIVMFSINLFRVKTINIEVPSLSIVTKNKEGVIKLVNLKKEEKVTNQINEYLDTLKTCYNETIHYDGRKDISIKKYTVNKNKMFNELEINYVKGNLCKDEFVLKDDWFNMLKDITPDEIVFDFCNMRCAPLKIENSKMNTIYDYFFKDELNRVSNILNIPVGEEYILSIYFTKDDNNYTLKIFDYDNNIAFKLIDQNDASKNAIYNYKDKSVQDLYNKLK